MITVRMPGVFRGKVSDQKLAAWVRQYAERTPALPPDPGPGRFKRSFRLSKEDSKLIEKFSRTDTSRFLRRLIALHLGSPTAPGSKSTASKPSNLILSGLIPALIKDNLARPQALRGSPKRTTPPTAPQGNNGQSTPTPIPPDMPPILYKPCQENGHWPMFRDNQWTRNPVGPEETKAYKELMAKRAKFRSK